MKSFNSARRLIKYTYLSITLQHYQHCQEINQGEGDNWRILDNDDFAAE